MKKLLVLAAISEGSIGLILLVYPPIVIRLLFGAEIAGPSVWISRFAGIALIGLVVACWPDSNLARAFLGMSTYSTLAMLYLAYVGLNGGMGILLWPAVAVHVGLSVLLVRAWWNEGRILARSR
jgi:hypothetical protein